MRRSSRLRTQTTKAKENDAAVAQKIEGRNARLARIKQRSRSKRSSSPSKNDVSDNVVVELDESSSSDSSDISTIASNSSSEDSDSDSIQESNKTKKAPEDDYRVYTRKIQDEKRLRQQDLSSFIERIRKSSTIYGPETEILKKLHYNSAKYESRKNQVFARFVDSMAANPELADLAAMVDDHGRGGQKVLYFYLLLRGDPDKDKLDLLNAALLNFSQSLFKIRFKKKNLKKRTTWANAQYQPSTVVTTFKQLFSVFSKNNILYSMSDFKPLTGSFHAYWKRTFAFAASYRCEKYGRKPCAGRYDDTFEIRIQEKLRNGELQPYSNPKHMQWMLTHYVLMNFALRGAKEAQSVMWSMMKFGKLKKGDFEGLGFVALLPNAFMKNAQLNLTSFYLDDNGEDYLSVCDDPRNPYCLYKLLHFYKHKMYPSVSVGNDFLFRRLASAKELEQYRRERHPSWCFSRRDGAEGCIVGDGINALCKEFAGFLGLPKPNLFTARSKRMMAVAVLNNTKHNVPHEVARLATRHRSISVHAGYHRCDQRSHDKKYKALQDGGMENPTFVREYPPELLEHIESCKDLTCPKFEHLCSKTEAEDSKSVFEDWGKPQRIKTVLEIETVSRNVSNTSTEVPQIAQNNQISTSAKNRRPFGRE